ncbi:D-erythrulose reductase [Paramyrothecium foliicola]|nr:D-erythrulose reductase [Paramyrothecium foliicola]
MSYTKFTKTVHKEAYPAISPTRPELSQAGKTVLITGGSVGIGYAIAEGFAQGGAKRIIIVGRRKEKNESSASKLHAAYPKVQVEGREADIGSLESTEKLWTALAQEGVFIDVLVLNAVKFPEPKPLFELGRDAVWDDFTVNRNDTRQVHSFSLVNFTQNGDALLTSEQVLLNVSTAAIHQFDVAPMPNYSLVKNAQTLLVQLLAQEVSPEEVQVISFHPGAIYSESVENMGLTRETLPWDNENLPGQFAVWAASSEARFLHGHFVWAAWDVTELIQGSIRDKLNGDKDFLKIGVKGVDNVPFTGFSNVDFTAKSS